MTEQLIQSIDANCVNVLQYERKDVQEKVLQTVPIVRLKDAALKAKHSNGITFHEQFMKELLRWFKKEFFKWVDCKPCNVCGSPSRSGPPLTPSPEELAAGGSRVENHVCTICGASQRFPRYNSVIKLLETKEGRCGEWANCFTAICRAVGYDARYVSDVTDHVWTEIFSPHLDRWVHVDACENAWDRPLMYEQGWKKQLSYIIAFSKDEVVDVSYRYSLNPNDLKSRRVDEAVILQKIAKSNNIKYRHTAEKKQFLTIRLAKEMTAMLLKPGIGTGEVYGGRESGSLAWRQQRGEGGTSSHSAEGPASHVIRTEGAENSFSVQYSPTHDKYLVTKDGNQQTCPSFLSLCNKSDNVIRKVEYDWNMVYLARGDSQPALIQWKVECTKLIKSAKITMEHATFQQGHVSWSCDTSDTSSSFCNQFSDIDLTMLCGATGFTITAKMSSPESQDNCWQHTQLFRTELGGDSIPFCIDLTF